eukprot:TRINITY_DN4209_c1_g2_i1.p1 TRINITY_DN4209_c1_g2~~TRINITY_DN4209_c1_g2_i1.p1  ORF type:complete len:712 (+),score=154.66 TRINITY_DN4209_c1_g2_i1:79-2136(+)
MAGRGGDMGEAVTGGCPSIVLDLEAVSERLHVDPRVLARHMHPHHEDADGAPAKEEVFPALSVQMLNDLMDGKSVILPGRKTVIVQDSPAARPGKYAQTTRVLPKQDRAKGEGWAGAEGHLPLRTPQPQHWRVRKWWETRRDQRKAEQAHHVHGVLLRAEPHRAPDAGTPLMPSASLRPILSTPAHPYSSEMQRYEFSSQAPKGVVNDADVMPIKAVVMPIKHADGRDHGERLLAVPMPDADDDAKSIAGSIAAGVLMSTRMRGRMPDEIAEVEVKIEADRDLGDRIYLIVHFARPFIGWAALSVGVLGQAMQGPVIKMINANPVGEPVNGFLLGAWNAQGLCILFTLWSVISVLNGDFGPRERAYLFSLFGFSLVALSGIISGLGSGAWTEAFALTSVPQGYLFNSFHPTLIILWRMLLCKSVLCMEKVGIVVGLVGASLSMMDKGPASSGAADIPQGDMLAFCSSLSLCFYLLASKKVRPHLPLNVNLAVVTLFSALSQLVLASVFVPGGISINFDQNIGMFGYVASIRWREWMLLNGVGCVAQAGYIGALKYLNPVVVSICMTCEPVMATWITYVILGQSLTEQGVGIYTVSGGFAIIAGSLVVSYYSKHHKEGVEIDVQADTVKAVDAIPEGAQESREWADFDLDRHKALPRTAARGAAARVRTDSPAPNSAAAGSGWKEA